MSTATLEGFEIARLTTFLTEDVDYFIQREVHAFDEAMQGRSKIALFGAGGVGRRTLAGMRRVGIHPLCFIDNDPSKWGTFVDDLRVCDPDDVLLDPDTAVLLTIWRGESYGQNDVRSQLDLAGCRGDRRPIPVGYFWWKYTGLFLPYYAIDLPRKVIQQKSQVFAAFELLADEESRSEFVDQVEWRLSLDPLSLKDPCAEEVYFPPSLVQLRDDEVFVDCGAYDGDTIKQFLDHTTQFKKIYAFEPDPQSLKKLRSFVRFLPSDIKGRIECFERGVSDFDDVTGFNALGNVSSAIDDEASLSIECVTLDKFLAGVDPTFIKMDIEGSEMEALEGARETIKRCLPILTICAYHKQADLWDIVNLIHEINPDYKIYIRRHMVEAWETCCYAIPPHRLVG